MIPNLVVQLLQLRRTMHDAPRCHPADSAYTDSNYDPKVSNPSSITKDNVRRLILFLLFFVRFCLGEHHSDFWGLGKRGG